MQKLFKKRQLILVTLVLALGAAVFVNWYYSDPAVAADARPVASAPAATPDRDEHLGDAQYVHNPMGASAREYFAGARLNRSAAHDEAREVLGAVIADSSANPAAVQEASASLQVLANAIRLQSECEALITAQTGRESLVVIGEDTVRAVVGGPALDSQTVTQIKEILLQKTDATPERIQIVELGG